MACLRLPAIDVSFSGALLTYDTSVVSWTAVTPAGTTIVVEAASDGETFSTQSNGAAIPGAVLTPTQSLTDVYVTFKVTLTSTGAATPTFSDFKVKVEGEEDSLTQSSGYFDFGTVKFTSGLNTGLTREVKRWDSTTRVIKTFLPFPFDVAIEDEFEILPGCDKLDTTCSGKFDNITNFRGHNFVPGDDAVNRFPDAN